MVGKRAGFERREDVKGLSRAHYLSLARVFEREPDFRPVGADREVRREWARLRDACHGFIGVRVHHIQLGREARRHESVLPVRAEQDHRRPVGSLHAMCLHHFHRVDDRNVVFASHRSPELATVGREECLVWRSANVHHAFDSVGGGVDEGDGV